MADILELAPQHMTRLHRQVRMFALQGLYASQLIHADGALSLLGPFRGLGIHLTPPHNFLVPLLIGYLPQPIPEAVRLQAPFLRSRPSCRGAISRTTPRA